MKDIAGVPSAGESAPLKTPVGAIGEPAPNLGNEELESGRRRSLLECAEAFHREFATMLGDHPGEWVAFVGTTRLGFGKTRTALIRECMSRGLRPGEFLVRRIEPQIEDVAETPHVRS